MANTPPIFYSFRRCPYAMRARLALASSGVKVQLREIVLRDKPAHMLQASPKGTVPVLVLANGSVLDESLDIMRWALAQSDPEGWWPNNEAARDEINHLIAQNDGPFKNALDRYKYPNRYEGESNEKNDWRTKGAAFLSDLNARLAKSKWLIGEDPSLADYAIAPFVRQYANVDKNWFAARDWVHLQQWLSAILEAPRFAVIMEKFTVWKDTGQSHIFPPD